MSGRLVAALALLLVASFVLTGLGLDLIYRETAAEGLRERLMQTAAGVGTLLRLDAQGVLDESRLGSVAQFSNASSGRYTLVRARDGGRLWQSPGPAGFAFDVGPLPEPGGVLFRELVAGKDGAYALLSMSLLRALPAGQPRELILTVAESRKGAVLRLHQFRRNVALWFAAVTACLLTLLGLLLRRVLEPLRRLGQEIAAIESGARSELGGGYPRELDGLARSLNALLRAEQQRMSRYRDTLGNLAHSLKTPLAVMRAALSGQGSDAHAVVDAQIDRITQLADHQLRRAGTAGAVTLGQRPVPVAPVVAELRTALLRVHGAKDLAIEVLCRPEVGFLGDRGDIMELLGNVLDNGCKWCRSTVHVQLRIDPQRPQQGALAIRVTDDGPGIAPPDRRRVLHRGVRADERAPGHGLGLAMVADTVALYGGDLTVGQSFALGGTAIDIHLPGRVLDAPS
jgi:two-component system sensor histidine kinase PhoQ